MKILAGDIGGTSTRLGVFALDGGILQPIHVRGYQSSGSAGLEDIVADFMRRSQIEVQSASFGIAGPVTGRRVKVTNLPWVVDADRLQETTGCTVVDLLNDLEATAWGVAEIGEADTNVLNPGPAGAEGNQAVIAAGTGLGEAGIYQDGNRARPFACEGGHSSFSPTDEVGDGLLGFLRRRYETVSWERVLSGPGLADIFRYLLEIGGCEEPEWFVEADLSGDPVPAIASAGLQGQCDFSERTLKLFARLYGEEAGNLALKLMATGGVWIGGGIAPKLVSVLEAGVFMDGFLNKGRMRSLLKSMPVRLVMDDRAALFGAARHAACNSANR